MEGSQQKGLNQKYLVTRIIHEGKQPQALDADAPEEASDYFNHFEVIPSGIEWRAEHYWHSDAPRKPRVDGPQLARVVGPAGEEIFCDEYGRVKLQFPWDRHGKGDEHSSCWVRVSQLWAGTKYGGMAIPRIGQEVIVEFLDGDIDQPIITGRTYNATNQVPYDLPVNKTRTTIKTDSHKADGFNELRFEDEGGKEEVFINAQKDKTINVNNDKNQTVGNNETHSIGNDHTHSVGHDRLRSVGNDETWSIGNDQDGRVGNNYNLQTGGDIGIRSNANYALDVADKMNINVGQKLQVEAIKDVEILSHGSTVQHSNKKHLITAIDEINTKSELTTIISHKLLRLVAPGGVIEINENGIVIESASVKVKGVLDIESGSLDYIKDAICALEKETECD